jgi:hypothetical protein
VVRAAVPPFRGAAPMLEVPSKKFIVPVAVLGATVAVKVKLVPTPEGDVPEVRARLVCVLTTAMPFPKSATVCVRFGTPRVSSVNTRLALRNPSAVG